MDPDAALKAIRTFTAHRDLLDRANPAEVAQALDEVLDLIDGLDAWLSRGGYMPEPWGLSEAAAVLGPPASVNDIVAARQAAYEARQDS